MYDGLITPNDLINDVLKEREYLNFSGEKEGGFAVPGEVTDPPKVLNTSLTSKGTCVP